MLNLIRKMNEKYKFKVLQFWFLLKEFGPGAVGGASLASLKSHLCLYNQQATVTEWLLAWALQPELLVSSPAFDTSHVYNVGPVSKLFRFLTFKIKALVQTSQRFIKPVPRTVPVWSH